MNYSTRRDHKHYLASSETTRTAGTYTCACGSIITGALTDARVGIANHIEAANQTAHDERRALLKAYRK